ncbi:MAG: hypothetical protein GY765_12330, partial [bacterium]|nr:hypothetical protein [bacterium]
MTDQNRGGSGRQSRFDEMDTDKNGFATLDEMLAHETEKFNNRNTRSNGNSQGNISLAQHLENEKEKFLKMDADGDTQLSKAETEQGESAGKRQERRSTSDEQTRGRQRNKENRQTTYKSPGRRATGRLKPGAAATGVTLGLEGLSGGDIGLVKNSSQAYPGYTLFAPKHRTMTYLIDNAGRVVHEWTGSKYEPGQTVYLLPNGNLLRCCFVHGHGLTRGGEGGRLEEYDWDGKLVWEFDYASDKYMLHHDIAILPNGNILALAVEKKSYKECIDAGFAPRMVRDTELYPDFVVEIEPTRPGGGKIVWEWHVWDHLIQDYAPNKQNYGNVAAHPERVYTHCNGRPSQAFWNHMNSIAYNEKLDQIMLSVRGCSEIWVIDHSTTAKQAAGRLGGKYGKGGDLLYRWGNPSAYKNGSSGTAARQLFDQHDAHWIPEGCPGAGNILVFNNGLERGYSSVMELVPPLDEKGNYSHGVSGRYGPVNTVWEYSAENGKRFYSSEISGAHRLPNGNTLICAGVLGVFFEVTPAGKTVWKYVNPVVRGG